MKGRYIAMFVIFFIATLLLIGCGKKGPVDSGQDSQKAESTNVGKVESATERTEKANSVVESEVKIVESTEFEDVQKSLLEAGILNEDTPVYRVGDIVEIKGSKFSIQRFSWINGRVVARLKFIGEEKQDENGKLWNHRIRLIIDGKKWLEIVANRREEEDGYTAFYRFQFGIPDSYENYVLVLASIKDPSRDMAPEDVKEGDVAFIVTDNDIVKEY